MDVSFTKLFFTDGSCRLHDQPYCNRCWPGIEINAIAHAKISVERGSDGRYYAKAFIPSDTKPGTLTGTGFAESSALSPQDAVRTLLETERFVDSVLERISRALPDAWRGK